MAEVVPFRVDIAALLLALARDDFEVRLVGESGALTIVDLRWKRGFRLRAPHPLLAKAVFGNADRIGRWLEKRGGQNERPCEKQAAPALGHSV
jgi:hypothetical protein